MYDLDIFQDVIECPRLDIMSDEEIVSYFLFVSPYTNAITTETNSSNDLFREHELRWGGRTSGELVLPVRIQRIGSI